MAKIEVHKATEAELKKLGCKNWPIWTCGVSTFPWHYDEKETCYILAGKVTVTVQSDSPQAGAGQTVSFGPGDLVIFPQGLDVTWDVSEPVRKHYRFG
jgi:hypothetical protein